MLTFSMFHVIVWEVLSVHLLSIKITCQPFVVDTCLSVPLQQDSECNMEVAN